MNSESDWKVLMDEIIELDESVVVVIGCADIIQSSNGWITHMFDKLTSNSFYRIIGRGGDEDIISELSEYDPQVDKEGEYEFKCIMRWITGDHSVGEHSYLEIKHMDLNFIQTFKQRDREYKLTELFNNKIDIF